MALTVLVLVSVVQYKWTQDYYEIFMNRGWQVDLTATFAGNWSPLGAGYVLAAWGTTRLEPLGANCGAFFGVLNAAKLPDSSRPWSTISWWIISFRMKYKGRSAGCWHDSCNVETPFCIVMINSEEGYVDFWLQYNEDITWWSVRLEFMQPELSCRDMICFVLVHAWMHIKC